MVSQCCFSFLPRRKHAGSSGHCFFGRKMTEQLRFPTPGNQRGRVAWGTSHFRTWSCLGRARLTTDPHGQSVTERIKSSSIGAPALPLSNWMTLGHGSRTLSELESPFCEGETNSSLRGPGQERSTALLAANWPLTPALRPDPYQHQLLP